MGASGSVLTALAHYDTKGHFWRPLACSEIGDGLCEKHENIVCTNSGLHVFTAWYTSRFRSFLP